MDFSLHFCRYSKSLRFLAATAAGVPFARFERTVSERPPRGTTLSWQWSRSPAGIWLEIAPPALSAVFGLDERTRRSLQSRLFALAELATVHPVPGPAMNLIADAGSFLLRYSLDLAGKRIVIEGLTQADRRGSEWPVRATCGSALRAPRIDRRKASDRRACDRAAPPDRDSRSRR